MAGIEPQVSVLRWPQDWRVVRGDRPQSAPGLGAIVVSRARQQRVSGISHQVDTTGVERSVVSGKLRRADHAHSVTKPGEDDAGRHIGYADARGGLFVGDRRSQRIALDWIDRQLDAEGPGQPRAPRTGRQHDRIRGQRTLVRANAGDPVAFAFQALYSGGITKINPAIGAMRRQGDRELMAVADLVAGSEHPTHELVAEAGQRRFDRRDARRGQPRSRCSRDQS